MVIILMLLQSKGQNNKIVINKKNFIEEDIDKFIIENKLFIE